MSFLLDTNVISAARRSDPQSPLRRWLAGVDHAQTFLSVLVVGELRRGVELLRRRDRAQADAIDSWLAEVEEIFANRILPIDSVVAHAWGRLDVPNRLPVADGLMLATAQVHGLTFVTRNIADVGQRGVPVLNPFEA